MPRTSEASAIAIARAHIDAWSRHDFEAAREALADDVHVTVTTTQPLMAPTDTAGADAYMNGLMAFAQTVKPGSARVIEAIGDDRNALILVTVQASFGPDAPPMTLPGARLYLIDENGKIKAEQVIFYATPA